MRVKRRLPRLVLPGRRGPCPLHLPLVASTTTLNSFRCLFGRFRLGAVLSVSKIGAPGTSGTVSETGFGVFTSGLIQYRRRPRLRPSGLPGWSQPPNADTHKFCVVSQRRSAVSQPIRGRHLGKIKPPKPLADK
jgi:hypothetical protein